MLLCVTPNPALDRTLTMPNVRWHDVNRATHIIAAAGGKGLNVARVVKLLGGDVRCAGPLGGHIGKLFAQCAHDEGLLADWTWIDDETRLATILVDGSGHDATVINENGPTLSAHEWRRLTDAILVNLNDASAITISGSVPGGPAPTDYANLLAQCAAAGKDVWADTSGDWLRAAAFVQGINIKVNVEEASPLAPLRHPELVEGGETRSVGEGAPSLADTATLAQHLRTTQQLRRVVITLGSKGAVMAGESGAWLAESPHVNAVSSVGSGDAFLGAMALAVADGLSDDEALRRAIAAGAANAMMLGGGRFDLNDYVQILNQVLVRPALAPSPATQ